MNCGYVNYESKCRNCLRLQNQKSIGTKRRRETPSFQSLNHNFKNTFMKKHDLKINEHQGKTFSKL